MKFSIPVRVLLDPIVKVSSICNSNPANAEDLSKFLSMEVRQDKIILLGTDNNVQMRAEIPLPQGACLIEGGCFIEATKIRDFMRTLNTDADLFVESDDERECLKIRSGSSYFDMRIRRMDLDNNEFPVFVIGDEQPRQMQIAERKLKYMIDKSNFCVSRDNYRDYLKGVRFEVENGTFTVLGLDGHRMAVLDTILENGCPDRISASLTLRGAQELSKNLRNLPDCTVTLYFSNNFVEAKLGQYVLTSRILNCNYPNVRAVLPSKEKLSPLVTVDLGELKAQVKSVSTFANKRLNNINLTFTQDLLTLYANNADNETATASLPSASNVPMDRTFEVNLNVNFVKDFLNAIETPSVIFGFSPPYANTMFCPSTEYNEFGVRARYIVSHIIV